VTRARARDKARYSLVFSLKNRYIAKFGGFLWVSLAVIDELTRDEHA
jgi:hypothetical protein